MVPSCCISPYGYSTIERTFSPPLSTGPLLYIIDGSTAVGVMDGVSSAVRAERLECGVLRVRDLNRPKRIRFALRAGQTAPICHNSDTNGAVDLCLRLASSGRLRFGKVSRRRFQLIIVQDNSNFCRRFSFQRKVEDFPHHRRGIRIGNDLSLYIWVFHVSIGSL